MKLSAVQAEVLLKEASRQGVPVNGTDGNIGIADLLDGRTQEYMTIGEFIDAVEDALDEQCSNGHFSRWTTFGNALYEDALNATSYFFNCFGIICYSEDEDLPF
jgi:hypothetical protein